MPTGDGQKRPLDNPLHCFGGLLDQPGSMEKPQIVCQMTLSLTLLFEHTQEPPGRIYGFPKWWACLWAWRRLKWHATWPPPASVNVVDDGGGEAYRPFFLLVGITVGW